MLEYSLGLIAGYASAKFLTPRVSQLKTRRLHIHHWIWISAALGALYFFEVGEVPLVYGLLTGGALQGLSYSNWSILRDSS